MLKIIGLDESGTFEKEELRNRFIGGYTVAVKDKAEYDALKDEIEECLRDFCEDFNTKHNLTDYIVYYPKSLHGMGEVFYKLDSGASSCFGMTLPTQLVDPAKVKKMDKKPDDPSRIVNGKKYYEDLLNDSCPSTEFATYEDLQKEFKDRLEEHFWKFAKDHNMDIYMYLYPTEKIRYSEYGQDVQSNIISVSDGINLYERMATMAMNHQIFYSIDEDYSDYYLEFATRKINDNEANTDQKEHMREVYTQEENYGRNRNNSANWYQITNTSTYKTSVATKLFEDALLEKYIDKNYYFNVKSINYSYNSNTEETTPFHYVADIVCSGLLGVAKVANRSGNWTSNKLEKFFDLISTKTGINRSRFSIKLYDKMDSMYIKMLSHINEVELDKFYEEMYRFEQMESSYKDFYKKYWMDSLYKYASYKVKDTAVVMGKTYADKVIGKLQDYYTYVDGMMGPREMECEKGAYIATKFLKLLPNLGIRNKRLEGKYIFRFNDVILRANNHRGDIKKNKKVIAECEKYKLCVGLEEYIEHTLRVAQYYFNALDFQKIINIFLPLTRNVHFVKDLDAKTVEETYTTKYAEINQLKRIYNEIFASIAKVNEMVEDNVEMTEEKLFEVPNISIPFVGKIYGTLSQAHSFLGNNVAVDEAEAAIKEFADDHGNADINICHLLHYYIEHDMKAYVQNAKRYFGEPKAEDNVDSELDFQLNQIVNDKAGFALYLYTKAFNRFYANNKINVKRLKRLFEVIKIIPAECKNVHPWELVYKNLYEAMLQQKEQFGNKDFEYVKNEALKSYKLSGATIQLIQLNLKLNSLEEKVELETKDVELMQQFFDVEDDITYEEAKKLLGKKLTYEYV